MSSNKKKSTFNAKKLSKKQKGELAKTGSFTTSTGAKRDATGATIGGTSSSSGKETVQQTVDRAKAMLGTAYNPNTTATQPVQQTVDRAKAMLSQTKAEGATPFAGSEAEKAYLAKYPAPTDVSAINPAVAPTTLPTGTPTEGNITLANARLAGMEAKNKAEEKRKLAEQKTRETEQKSTLQTFMDKMISPNDAREAAQKETGIDVKDYFAEQEAGIKEVESLTNDYNAVVAARDQQIAQSNDKMASMNFINNQIAQIERNAAPKLNEISANINAKAAMLEAQQGNFAQAQSFVNQAVQDATAENKFQFDSYTAMYELNKDNFDRIDSIYADSFKASMDLAQLDYEEQLADKKMIGQLMLENPQAGIDIYKDSLDDAFNKIGINPMSPSRRLTEAQIANTWSNATDSSAGGSGGVVSSAEAAGDGGRLSELFNLVVGSAGSVTEIKRQVSQFNQYIASGNIDAAQEMVNSLAVKNMSAEQRNRFVAYGNISNAIDNAMENERQFSETNPGLYRSVLESAKPFVNASTDPVWQAFVAETQNSINVYRNEIFGASLTGNELKTSNISLPDWGKDTAGTIFTKLRALQDFAETTREGTLRNTTGQYSSPALGQEPTPQNIIESTSVYDETTGQQSEGGWFSKFISWLR